MEHNGAKMRRKPHHKLMLPFQIVCCVGSLLRNWISDWLIFNCYVYSGHKSETSVVVIDERASGGHGKLETKMTVTNCQGVNRLKNVFTRPAKVSSRTLIKLQFYYSLVVSFCWFISMQKSCCCCFGLVPRFTFPKVQDLNLPVCWNVNMLQNSPPNKHQEC